MCMKSSTGSGCITVLPTRASSTSAECYTSLTTPSLKPLRSKSVPHPARDLASADADAAAVAATGETVATIARAAVAVDAEVSAGASVGAGAGVEALLLLTSKMCASRYVFSLYSIRSFPETKIERFRNARSTVGGSFLA
mmetsp:Transcript_7110/g.13111  ORF Transcript_7110/g.13111 Transcript_7110/m.13111 type:complete len:140 (+) Transcript_7110:195-614(+)